MTKRTLILAAVLLGGIGAAGGTIDMSEARADETMDIEEIATLGGGCFWCLDAVFRDMEGVRFVVSGYAGGHDPDPTYKEVCAGETGHAEVVQVTFDPREVTYSELLAVFFTIHDPTTLNRQGADVGTQYRSAVYTHSPEQEKVVREVIADLEREKVYRDPVVTEIAPLEKFHAAEEYHQDYFRRNPTQGYCRAVIAPKVQKFRQKYGEMRRQ